MLFKLVLWTTEVVGEEMVTGEPTASSTTHVRCSRGRGPATNFVAFRHNSFTTMINCIGNRKSYGTCRQLLRNEVDRLLGEGDSRKLVDSFSMSSAL